VASESSSFILERSFHVVCVGFLFGTFLKFYVRSCTIPPFILILQRQYSSKCKRFIAGLRKSKKITFLLRKYKIYCRSIKKSKSIYSQKIKNILIIILLTY
jgi:hypothetical protein